MFCTRCGKKLNDEDVFCSNCGNRVKPEPARETDSRYADVVFNPPFKMEAERRTQEISRELEQENREPQRERIKFDWDLDSFPTQKPKKDDDFSFNWDDVLEKRPDRHIDVEKIEPAEEKERPAEPERYNPNDIPPSNIRSNTSSPLTIEELEKELFGSAPESTPAQGEKDLEMTLQYKRDDFKRQEDKFYTYNAKRDAFQELIDRERQRIAEMEKKHEDQWDTIAGQGENAQGHGEPPAFEDIFREPEIFTEDYLKEDSVALPPQPDAVDLSGEEAAGNEAEAASAALAAAAVASDGGEEMAETSEAAETAETSDEEAAAETADEPAEAEEPSEPAGEEQAEPADGDEQADGIKAAETAAAAAAAAGIAAGIAGEVGTEEAPFLAEEEHEKKTKLRYSDIFSYDHSDLDGGDSDTAAAAEEEVTASAGDASGSAERVEHASAGDASGSAEGAEHASAGDASGPTEQAEQAEAAPKDAPEEKSADGEGAEAAKISKAAAIREIDESDDEEYEKYSHKKKKGAKHTALKVAIIILAILIACELVIIGVKLVAPESAFNQKVDKLLVSIGSIFTGGDDEEEPEQPQAEEPVTAMTGYINAIAGETTRIGRIAEDPALKYDVSKDYAFAEIKDSMIFEDAAWREENGSEITLGQGIVESVVKYFDGLEGSALGENMVGINKLELGEIRNGLSGYYVLCRVTLLQQNEDELVSYRTVYLKVSEESISVEDVKEESI